MAAPAPTRRGFLAGLLAAPLALPAAGAAVASERAQILEWLREGGAAAVPGHRLYRSHFHYADVGVPMLKANRIPPFDPSLGEGVWRRLDPVLFHCSLSDLRKAESA